MQEEWVYGVHAVEEALASERTIARLYIASDSRVRRGPDIMQTAKAARVPIERVPLAKLNALTGTGEHQGVAASISPIAYLTLQALLNATPGRACILLLDQVQFPRNLGLIIRSALGAGAAGLILPERGGALVDDAVVRASAGTALRLPIARVHNLGQALRTCRDAGFWNYGLAGDGTDSVFDLDWPERTLLVLGNETKGLRPSIRKSCDAMVRIPLANDLDSLNVAVAAGIALFQATNTRNP